MFLVTTRTRIAIVAGAGKEANETITTTGTTAEDVPHTIARHVGTTTIAAAAAVVAIAINSDATK